LERFAKIQTNNEMTSLKPLFG